MRGFLRTGLLLGLLGGAASALVRLLQKKGDPLGARPPTWPPLTSEPGPVLPESASDVAAAPGVDWAPRDDHPDDGGADGGPGTPASLPESEVETHEGADADADSGDRSNQPTTPTPDWVPDESTLAEVPPTATVPAPTGTTVPTEGTAAAQQVWVAPAGGSCPTSHPVKAKLNSSIYHLPGMLNYDRTIADRCYLDAATAESDGLRAAKR